MVVEMFRTSARMLIVQMHAGYRGEVSLSSNLTECGRGNTILETPYDLTDGPSGATSFIFIWTSEVYPVSIRRILCTSAKPFDYIALLPLSTMCSTAPFTGKQKLHRLYSLPSSLGHIHSCHHSQMLPISSTQVYTITKAPRQYRQLPSLVL